MISKVFFIATQVLVAVSKTIFVASKTLDVISKVFFIATKTLVAISKIIFVISNTLDVISKVLDATGYPL